MNRSKAFGRNIGQFLPEGQVGPGREAFGRDAAASEPQLQ
jgi:hypothetical protein